MFQQKKVRYFGIDTWGQFFLIVPFQDPTLFASKWRHFTVNKPTHDQLHINKLFCDLVILGFSVEVIPRVDEINAYLDRTIEELKAEIAAFPAEHRADWAPLNELFLNTISSYF